MPDTSIVIKASDRYSDVVKRMSTTTKSFNKDVDGMETNLSNLSKMKVNLKIEVKDAKKALSEAEKQFAATRSEADRLNLEMAQVNYDNAVRNLKAVSDAARDTEKEISKLENRAGGGGGGGGGSGGGSILSGFAAAGFGDMAKDLALGVGTTFIGSALGGDAGTMAGSILSYTAMGASMGAMFGPVGAAIGAGVGALMGAIDGAAKNFEKKDDFFKNYYSEAMDSVIAAREEAMEAGIEVAGGREQDAIAFAKRLGGTAQAEAFLDDVKSMSASTNYSYEEITGYAKSLLNTYSTDETLSVLQTLSDATAGLSLSSSDVSIWISGLSRMRTTNKATMEYLNFFSERGLDVYDALSKGLGVDKTAIAGMVSKGQITGVEAAEILLDYMNTTFGGLSQELMNTYDALMDNLEDVQTNIDAGYGTGYNNERKDTLADKIATLDGPLGDTLTFLSEMGGFAQGYADNVKDNYWMDIMEAVFNGDQTLRQGVTLDDNALAMITQYQQQYQDAYAKYQTAEARGDEQAMFEAAQEMTTVRDAAEVLATEVYNASDTNLTLIESQTTLTEQTRILADKFGGWAAEYAAAQAGTKGLGAGAGVGADQAQQGEAGYGVTYKNGGQYVNGKRHNAWGLDRVPYDNYPALLHEGERVLTAAEAREADRGAGVSVVISGNQFHIREDADVDRVAEALAQKLQLAAVRG